ncbi:putative Allergen, partial [Operophtera brumata]
MEAYYGLKYKLDHEENFDDLLVFLAGTLSPVQSITKNDDGTYSLHFSSLVVSYDVVFTPGVEFEETKPGGVKTTTAKGLDKVRKLAATLSPVQSITKNDDGTYSLHFSSLVVSYDVVFTPGVECGVSRCRCHGDLAPGRGILTPVVSAPPPASLRSSDTRYEKAQPP